MNPVSIAGRVELGCEMPIIRGYRDLVAWQKAMDLVDGVFELAAEIQRPELFALVDQMRRAAISVPANIAEGHGRRSRGEYIRFVTIANGSLPELETHLLIAARRTAVPREKVDALLPLADEVGRIMTGLHRRLTRPARTS
jgi:four helix bundle protein